MSLPSDETLLSYVKCDKTAGFFKKYVTPLTPLIISILPIYFYSLEDYKKVNWNQYVTMFVGTLIPLVIADLSNLNISRMFGIKAKCDVTAANDFIYDEIIKHIDTGKLVKGQGGWISRVWYVDQFGNMTSTKTPITKLLTAMFHGQICRFTFQDKEYAYMYENGAKQLLFAPSSPDTLELLSYLEPKAPVVTDVRIASFRNEKGYGPDVIVYEHKITQPQLLVDEDNERCINSAILQFMDPIRRAKFVKLGLKNKMSLFLYGPPGTGKSSIAAYIAGTLKRNIFYVDKKEPDKFFKEYIKKIEIENTVVVFDDVDFLNMSDRIQVSGVNGEQVINKTLVSLMDMLDGNSISDNGVFIFTTNHENNFDEALFRPGRITNKLHISLMTPSMWAKLIHNVYGVENFKLDHPVTLSAAVNDFIMPNIDDFEAFAKEVGHRRWVKDPP